MLDQSALAQQTIGGNRHRQFGHPGRLGCGDIFQLLIGQRDEDHQMPRDEPRDRFDHQFGAGGIGEIGKYHHQRSPCETTGQSRQREGEIGFLGVVVKPSGGTLQPVEIAGVADERAGEFRPRGKAEQSDPVAAFQRDIGGGERGGNRTINPRHAANRFAHRLPAIEGEDDLVVALNLIFLGIEVRVAG